MGSGRTREVRAPVTAVVGDELLAKQWMIRFSEDNVTLAQSWSPLASTKNKHASRRTFSAFVSDSAAKR